MATNTDDVNFRICSKCNTTFSKPQNDGDYCELCGTKLIKKCPKCNKLIESKDAKYCRHCGAQYFQPSHP